MILLIFLAVFFSPNSVISYNFGKKKIFVTLQSHFFQIFLNVTFIIILT